MRYSTTYYNYRQEVEWHLKIYLVGGAVRDQLLGLPVTERDYVVVGATPEEMIAQGYKPVGKEFPVFLHPQTKEEYALARTERKIAKGYKGFTFYAAPEVTLQEDLKRRDLTINAMAETPEGEIIDYYGGQQDLKNKILRHVSPAFAEDPVRILRVARFAARFADFQVHPETMQLMRDMVQAGEVDALVPERVWQEMERALGEVHPERFFETLKNCNALTILFAEIDQLTKAMVILHKAAELTTSKEIRFAAMLYNVTEQQVQSLCDRYRVPNEYRDLALLVVRNRKSYEMLNENSGAEFILNLLEKLDVIRRPERFEKFLAVCKINYQNYQMANKILQNAYEAINNISIQNLLAKGFSGKAMADELRKLRIAAIEKIKKD